jgi:hypothetical protein
MMHQQQMSTPSLPREPPPYFDSANLVQCRAFVDAKRKLRLVLSRCSGAASSTLPPFPGACDEKIGGDGGNEQQRQHPSILRQFINS